MTSVTDRSLNLVAEGPEAGPTVLLLHGITSSLHTWDWLVPQLRERYRVLRLDFRGHGDSANPADGYPMAEYVADALAAIGDREPVIAIGHSLGGAVALELAQFHADRVRAVLAEDPPISVKSAQASTRTDGEAASPAAGLTSAFALMRESIPRLQGSGISVDDLTMVLAKAPSSSGQPFGDILHPDGVKSMAIGMLKADATVLDPVLDGRLLGERRYLSTIAVPTVIVAADPTSPDAVVQPDAAAQLQAESPDVEVMVMPGAGHMIHDELAHRDSFATVVDAFLKQHAAQR